MSQNINFNYASCAWLQEQLGVFGKAYEQLDTSQRAQLLQSAREELHKNQFKVIGMGATAALVTLVAIPVLAVVSFLVGTGLLVITPDSLFFPLAAGGVCAAGYGSFKLFHAIKTLFQTLIARSLERTQEIQDFLHQSSS